MTEPLFDTSKYDPSTRVEITQGGWVVIHGLIVEQPTPEAASAVELEHPAS